MIEILLTWLGAIIATEAVVELIVASSILFRARDWIAQRSAFFGELIHCGYCTSVWVAALLFSYYLPVGDHLNALCASNILAWLIVLIAKAAIVHRLSNMVHEKFSRWLSKHKFGIEVVHTNVGSNNGRRQAVQRTRKGIS